MIPKDINKAPQTHKLEYLRQRVPNSLNGLYTVVPDQITGNKFALAKIKEGYKLDEYYAHAPKSNFMTLEKLAHFLLGMQLQTHLIKQHKIKL